MMPSGAIAQINVAISARCSSVSMPAKLINSLCRLSFSFHASVVSVYKNGKKTSIARPIAETLQPKFLAT